MAAEDGRSLNRRSPGEEYDNGEKKPRLDDTLDGNSEIDKEEGRGDSGSELVMEAHVLNLSICCTRGWSLVRQHADLLLIFAFLRVWDQ